MTAGTGVEVDLAIARGETYMHKARFRSSNILTVGTNPMTAIRLEGDGIPDFLEFLNISPDEVLLRFTPEIQVEVLSGSQVVATRALIDGGFARPSGDAFGVVLETGGKAVIRLGPYKLMIKVDPPTDTELLSVAADDPDDASCGRCGTKLRLVLAGGGALTPCSACGVFNRVSVTSTRQQQMEDQQTRMAMPVGVETDPDSDAPAANLARGSGDGDEPVDPGSSTGRGVSELPTFDAISVLRSEDAPDGGADALQQLGLGDSGDDASPMNLAADPGSAAGAAAELNSPDAIDPGSSTGRAASDLPTFDAIAVLKEDAPAAPRAATINLANTPDDPEQGSASDADEPAPVPAAPPLQEIAVAEAPPPLPEPASPPAPKEEESVTQTPPPSDPTEASQDFSPTTGQWEETLTIQAVKPKPRSMLPWIIVMVIAFLGMIGLAAIIVAIRLLPGLL